MNRKFYNGICTLFLLLLSSAITSQAAAGDLDTTFHFDGIAVIDLFPNALCVAEAVVIQADGKIVVAGGIETGLHPDFNDFIVARFNPDGSLDMTFDGDGMVVTDFEGSYDFARAISLQADGKILVAGVAAGANFGIARYNTDGSLDTTFDGDGKLLSLSGSASSMAIQTNGRILVGGGSAGDFLVVRYRSDGSLDTSFNDGGSVSVDIGGGTSDYVNSLAIQTDGKIILAGSVTHNSQLHFALARITTNGLLDATFDGDGRVITDFPSNSDARSVAVQPDGKILAAGFVGSLSNQPQDIALVRYNVDGSLDSGFGGTGKIVTSISPGPDAAYSVKMQPDGKILVGGYHNNADFAVLRYGTNGALDSGWGTGGVVTTNIGNPDKVKGLAIQADGKIVAAGNAGGGTIVVARYAVERQGNKSPFDFDGDGKTDIGIFRPGPAEWWYSRSSDNQVRAAQFGAGTDRITPGDFTGDGKADIAFWRPSSGYWFVLRSEDGSFFSFPFGTNGDVPVPADYDGDGKMDAAVFRPSTNTWYILQSGGGSPAYQFGATGDLPVPADYDGDGKADIAIFRPGPGEWWISRSTAGLLSFQFGAGTDKAVQGDYTGDGKADAAFFRPNTGFWFVLRSEDFSFYSAPFGTSGDVAAPGDYDGDGKFDLTVFRPSAATWYVQRSTAGTAIVGFGANGDIPVPSAFVR